VFQRRKWDASDLEAWMSHVEALMPVAVCPPSSNISFTLTPMSVIYLRYL
jgi:hypothetical protein